MRLWGWGRGKARKKAGGVVSEAPVSVLEWNTGRWVSPYAGDVLTVRWDPAARVFFVDGVAWVRREDVRAMLLRLEEELNWAPKRDNPTRAARARLDLPGWETS